MQSAPMGKGSIIVAGITLVLFVTALFVKGITHDLFLETGVFLVSIKIIMLSHRNNVMIADLHRKLDAILTVQETQCGRDNTSD